MPKVSPDSDPTYIPNVVYVTPMKLKPSNVLIGVLVGAVIIAIGVIGAYIILYGSQPGTSNNSAATTGTSNTTTATPSAKKDETEGWKTIMDDVNHVSYKYPNDWVVVQDANVGSSSCYPGYSRNLAVGLKESEKTGIGICGFSFSTTSHSAGLVKNTAGVKVISEEHFTLGKNIAIKITYIYKDDPYISTFIETAFNIKGGSESDYGKKGNLQVVGVVDEEYISLEEFSKIFDQVLSTFKFLY